MGYFVLGPEIEFDLFFVSLKLCGDIILDSYPAHSTNMNGPGFAKIVQLKSIYPLGTSRVPIVWYLTSSSSE